MTVLWLLVITSIDCVMWLLVITSIDCAMWFRVITFMQISNEKGREGQIVMFSLRRKGAGSIMVPRPVLKEIKSLKKSPMLKE